MLGEVIFGGVGAGLYGMLLFAILAVFIAGLMVGRTPEYLGKKIEANEVKMAMLAILILPLSILGFTAHRRGVADCGTRRHRQPGPARLLARCSTPTRRRTGNNGSAFAGICANTPFYNTTLGLAMLFGRFLMIMPMLAVAGSLAAQEDRAGLGRHLPDRRPLFVGLLVGVDPDRRRR